MRPEDRMVFVQYRAEYERALKRSGVEGFFAGLACGLVIAALVKLC